MRTKTLLFAAAALAASITASQAQTVYSQNVVGYINITVTNGTLAYAPINWTPAAIPSTTFSKVD